MDSIRLARSRAFASRSTWIRKTSSFLKRLIGRPRRTRDEVDPSFQNGQYWLLFPLHLSWDRNAKVEDTGTHKLPLGKGSATRVVVTYPTQGGYTPGDVWELFLGADGRVKQFIWRLAGSATPTIVASWDGYKKVGPLLIAFEHRGTLNGKLLRVFFSDVSVKLAGSSTWVDAR